VITKRQVWVGVVCKGCDNVALNSSYANRYVIKLHVFRCALY